MRISDWSSDVCSSDLVRILAQRLLPPAPARIAEDVDVGRPERQPVIAVVIPLALRLVVFGAALGRDHLALGVEQRAIVGRGHADRLRADGPLTGPLDAVHPFVPIIVAPTADPPQPRPPFLPLPVFFGSRHPAHTTRSAQYLPVGTGGILSC